MSDQSVGTAALRVGLWDDNPAEYDLLGFDAVVAPILAALREPDLDPITIGVHGPWGGGKSTLLKILKYEGRHGSWEFIVTNPWEYDDQFDVKGTLIAEVLGRLQARAKADEGLKDRFEKLFKRISWSRVGIAVARGVLTTQWDPGTLVEAFSPKNEEGPRSLADFREEFGELLLKIEGLDRVVVLVDDLDRCLPEAVVSTLEAIKLFLSVKRMAFVIAADQDMIRDAIAASLNGTGRSEVFAERYLEKIVQLPVALPRLSQDDAEAYITMLLVRTTDGESAFSELMAHCRERRAANIAPLIGDLYKLTSPPSPELRALAGQIIDGLSPSKRGNPREIKRFLNAFAVRSTIAENRGVAISPSVLAKMLFLELEHRPDFERLVALDETQRAESLAAWEAWGRGEKEAEKPDAVRDETRGWAASDPPVAGEDLERYISLAASLAAASMRSGLSDELRGLVRQLVNDSQAIREVAVDAVEARAIEDQRQVIEGLFAESRRAQNVQLIVESLVAIGTKQAALVNDIAQGIKERIWRRLEAADAVTLASSPVERFKALASEMVEDPSLDDGVRAAAVEMLGSA
jgi:hypothetical protein